MVEKNAIVGTMSVLLKDHYVRIAQNRGHYDWGFAHRYVGRMRHELYYTDIETGERKPTEEVHLWYLGDRDRDGLIMDRGINDLLAVLGIGDWLKLQRITVTKEQVEEHGLTESDKGGYEVNALEAALLSYSHPFLCWFPTHTEHKA